MTASTLLGPATAVVTRAPAASSSSTDAVTSV
jgi:hypothetical protein